MAHHVTERLPNPYDFKKISDLPWTLRQHFLNAWGGNVVRRMATGRPGRLAGRKRVTESLLLSTADLFAVLFFVAVWFVYGLAVEGRMFSRPSLTAAMNAQRRAWMRAMARRDLRMVDTAIMAGLQQGTAFFASASLIALGGALALLQQTEPVMTVLADLPLVAPSPRGLFELKVLGLTVLFAYSFFKFGWAYRLLNYCSILLGAVPASTEGPSLAMDAAVERAVQMNMLGGKHFNAGLRGIFFSIGYLGWFVGPEVFAVTTLLVAAVLARRQFFSKARASALSQP